MSFTPLNPRPMLKALIDQPVAVRLKWGEVEYHGKLVSIDSYMNLQLSETEEYVNDKPSGQLGQVLIRYVSTVSLYNRAPLKPSLESFAAFTNLYESDHV
jgi:small nuclear ribonucleoprotein F